MSKDVAKIVTDRIIEALEAGVAPWARPWKRLAGSRPTSLATGKAYRGINVLILETTAMLEGYSSPYWTTFKQAKERGGNVRKGEKGTAIVLTKAVSKTKTDDDGNEQVETFRFLRYFTVWNLEQCEGIEAPAGEVLPEFEPIEAAEELVKGMKQAPQVKTGGDRAFYSPTLDYVQMPRPEAFEAPEAYYSVLLHELAHATGHETRLDRSTVATSAPFGSETYAQEELVAEIASAMLNAHVGLEPNIERSAAYVGSWLKFAKENRPAIIKAASAAQKAADWITGEGA